MLFHMGVLRYLAEQGRLEMVDRISTVSGGSLLVGLILQETSLKWPTSRQFIDHVYPALKTKFCARSLLLGAARQLLRPTNWQFLLSRANLLSLALKREWGVTAEVANLPVKPEWSINGTTAENGKRFRFKRDSLGDYSIGYADPGGFPLSAAMAVSAAFPGGFGPLALDATRFAWKKRPAWGASEASAAPVSPAFPKLHLYDGGVYDNLGLEPYFDAGKGKAKQDNCFILVSDAGAPLPQKFDFWATNPFRLKRVADIMAEQARALRVRTFMHYLAQDATQGAYVYIGIPAAPDQLVNGQQPALFPTSLSRVTEEEFDGLAAHGYRQAEAPVDAGS